MDRATKRRLALGFLSNWVGKMSSTVVQLVGVPVFLHFWSVPLYGSWVILNSIPSYLSFSNIGFGNVAANEMSMMTAREDYDGALGVFQSCWWLIAIICGASMLLLGAGLFLVPVTTLLKLTEISETDGKWIVFYLGSSVLLAQLEQLLQSAYRCVGRWPYGSFIKNCFSLLAFASMLIPVSLGAGARRTALVFALVNMACTITLCIMVKRDIPWITYGWGHARFSEIKRLTMPSIAFMAFPIGNALNLQGSVLAVGYALGPTDVVIFSTARTVSRVALQMVQMVNNTFWPEMSSAFGKSDTALTRALHRRACQMALILAAAVVAAMMALGPWFLHRWTGGHVPPSPRLLAILLLVVVVYALWSTSSTLLTAINRHQKLATYYLIATGMTCVVCYFAARQWGLLGAAGSLLLSEFIMNGYVLPASLKISDDTFSGFAASMFHYPASLRLGVLVSRLRRSKPQLES